MGLGKTLQALATILYWRHEWPVLIVVPSSLRLQWADQVQQWIPNIIPTDINISTSKQTLHLYHHLSLYSWISSFDLSLSLSPMSVMNSKCNVNGLINIISYDLVPKLFDKIKAKNFKIVIADESHFLKNSRVCSHYNTHNSSLSPKQSQYTLINVSSHGPVCIDKTNASCITFTEKCTSCNSSHGNTSRITPCWAVSAASESPSWSLSELHSIWSSLL
jgi:hypothetical protein